METRARKAKREARCPAPFSARLVTRGGIVAQPDCKRCAVDAFASPADANAFATTEGAAVGCLPCKRLRYWDFSFDGQPVRLVGAPDAEFVVLRAGEVLLVRVRCLSCLVTSGALFRRDGAHVPILTCCKQGRLLWREGDSLGAL
ncbi:MAG TPA: hypothetical protein VNI01_10130 [Elusimicrobiota bacterium]|jgi:hypothetical protein|nr:hypothetical protein [Elusimicrobiota bacterium]